MMWCRFLFLFALMASLQANANPRTLRQKAEAAATVLDAQQPGGKMRSARPLPKMLKETPALSIMGYEDGGFAVIPNDDHFPEVMGYSMKRFNPTTTNENFKWWLETTETMLSLSHSIPFYAIKPDTTKYPASVAPLLSTEWGQESPYSDMTPYGYPTGCVATAAAQVVRYNRWPLTGTGVVYTFYPFGDFDGVRYEENIEGVEYLYDNMLNRYEGRVGVGQKRAVARLMYHLGLAMKAQYMIDGTGSYSETLCHGLRNHFGYPLAICIEREDYTDEEWMDIIYSNISQGHPIIYGGSDNTYNGHEFVLHGYNASGKVYINWGWDGDEDGYFDLASLRAMWGLYDLRFYQDMLLRVSPEEISFNTQEVNVETPGTLAEKIETLGGDSIIGLVVKGFINSTDLRTLRYMAGADTLGLGTMGNLSFLDLSGATIVGGGKPYLIENGKGLDTDDNAMPDKAFYKCSKLIQVSLPGNLQHYGDGAFAECQNLDKVLMEVGEDADFVTKGNFVLTADSTELIEYLPSEEVDVVIPDGVRFVHEYAFAGRFLYERVTLPETVDSIGGYAFNRCFDLSRTYILAQDPPAIDPSAIDKLDLSLRYLYVPQGSRSQYMEAEGWKLYRNKQIKEFEVTNVQQLRLSHKSDNTPIIYDLQGRSVVRPNGIYIKNGKKYVKPH